MLYSMEFEIPLVSFVFLVLLAFVYLSKERVKLQENRMFNNILFFSLIESFFDTVLHFIGAFNSFEIISEKYYSLIDYINKFLVLFFIIIFVSYLKYILMISNEKVRTYEKLSNFISGLFYIVMFLIMQFTHITLVQVNNVTNVSGSTSFIGYTVVALCLFISLIISLPKYKEKDPRYYSVSIISIMLLLSMLLTMAFPGIIIYDFVLSLMCYVMYFTIENPDLKMIQQLELAKEQADKANSAKTDFLSSMSHEIRTPLNAIVGFSDCIMEAKDLGEAKENAKDIVSASETLLEIVNGILDISKIEAGKLEIVNSTYNAVDTFIELAKLITPKMREKGLDFTYNIAPDLPKSLYGDHANIKKIVTNLLSNACKYTEKGFVHYEVHCINSGNISKLIISVEDSGRGIKKDSIDKLFTKFQRLDEDRNTTIEGTGLGLAITKQLIELMGGKIIVHTVYGEGSKFTVVLNQRIDKGDLSVKKKVKSTLDLRDVRILLVDDTPLNLKVASKLLEKYNANQIVTADSGFECFQRIRRGEVYDLILLDDMMPKMSGVETLKKMKELPGFNTPTIALTANAITGMREKYLADGFDDFLAKPIEKEQLIQVINQVLGRSVTEELDVNNFLKDNSSSENIRGEEVLDVVDIDRETNSKDMIIPVEDNIEEIIENRFNQLSDDKTLLLNPLNDNKVETLEEDEPILTPVVAEDEKIDENYLKKNGVDLDHSLELLGDMEMFNMTIHDFVEEVEEKWNNIVLYKNKKDMKNYAILVHSLKSDCKYLGFMKLADVAYQHELKSKEEDVSFVEENFPELENEYNKVLKIAKTYVSSI